MNALNTFTLQRDDFEDSGRQSTFSLSLSFSLSLQAMLVQRALTRLNSV